MLYWPSKEALQELDSLPSPSRPAVEYTDNERNSMVISFPSCSAGDSGRDQKWRYLQQAANFVIVPRSRADALTGTTVDVSNGLTMDKFGREKANIHANSLHSFLRDHIRLTPNVFNVAARVIAHQVLGGGVPFQFAALHIRRNDLQYKNSFTTAANTLENIRALLRPGEPVYIATDEVSVGFFQPIQDEFGVVQWKDFFNTDGTSDGSNKFSLDLSFLEGGHVSRKVEGLTEMVICSMARVFIGTPSSTFTAYIRRLRGYIKAPDTTAYDHTRKYNEPNPSPNNENAMLHNRPMDIYHDNPVIWNDLSPEV